MPKLLLTQSDFQNKSYARHAHDGYSISLVQEGVHNFIIEGEKIQAEVGEVRIIHPYEEHETLESTWRHINLSLESITIEKIALSMQIELPVVFSRLISDSTLEKILLHLYEMYTKEDHKGTKKLSDVLIHYLLEKHHFVCDTLPILVSDPQIEQARTYIHIHAKEADLNLDEVAKEAQMSKYHFLRRFKQTLGRTPHQYLQNIRIDCVRKQILKGRSLSESAHSCGFYDQSHMIRIYKKFYGHTPGAILPRKVIKKEQ